LLSENREGGCGRKKRRRRRRRRVSDFESGVEFECTENKDGGKKSLLKNEVEGQMETKR